MKLPPPLAWLYRLWMAFSQALGKVMSFIILTILWVIGFGIYAFVFRVMTLARREGPKATYWSDVQVSPGDSLRHQF